MKMKDVQAGMEVIVFGRPATVKTLGLNGCIIKFDDGDAQQVSYDKLKVKEK